MEIHLHANARTTPKTRAMIQSSSLPVAELARKLGVSETTVRHWKKLDRVIDGSHTRHNLGQSTTETEEALIAGLRRDVGLSLDDIVEVMKRCVNPKLSRSSIHRCLGRLGLAKRPLAEDGDRPGKGHFAKDVGCGFVHIDLKHLPRLRGRPSYVFVAIERASRFVHVEIVDRRDGATVAKCLDAFLAAFPRKVHTILTDNGSEFTDRFAVEMKDKPFAKPSGRHPFDRVCRAAGVEHRLTKPFHPQTNGMVERFNRRLAEALRSHPAAGTNSGKNRFASHDDRNAFICRVVEDYNRTRLRCLGYVSPADALSNQPGHNTFAGVTGELRRVRVFPQPVSLASCRPWSS